MGIERDSQSNCTRGVGTLPEPADQSLMAPMNSIKVANCQEGATGPLGKFLDVFDRDHQHRPHLEGTSRETARLPLIDPFRACNIITTLRRIGQCCQRSA